MNGFAVPINIEEELAAIRAGQCAHCRIGATHVADMQCNETPKIHNMVLCEQCLHRYNAEWFDECPMHKPDPQWCQTHGYHSPNKGQ